MIKENIVKGRKDTSYHNFAFTQSGMDITISSGSYFRVGQILFEDADGGTITIPTSSNEIEYHIMLGNDGIHLVYETGNRIFSPQEDEYIDRLGWFTVPANAISLDDVEINVIKMEEIVE